MQFFALGIYSAIVTLRLYHLAIFVKGVVIKPDLICRYKWCDLHFLSFGIQAKVLSPYYIIGAYNTKIMIYDTNFFIMQGMDVLVHRVHNVRGHVSTFRTSLCFVVAAIIFSTTSLTLGQCSVSVKPPSSLWVDTFRGWTAHPKPGNELQYRVHNYRDRYYNFVTLLNW